MPMELDPEVKWRTMIGIFLNYMSTVHNVLKAEVDDETHKKIMEEIGLKFWGEQAGAFVNIFNINPGNAIDVSIIEKILAALFDLKMQVISENEEEVVFECEYRFCPIRIGLRPTLGEYCKYCGWFLQLLIDQIDPNFKHDLTIEGDICHHIISRK